MPNLINLNIVYDSSGLLTGLNHIDLICSTSTENKKISSSIYDISADPPLKVPNQIDHNTKILTKIEDCNGSYYLVSDPYGKISDAQESNCEFCQSTPIPGGAEVDPVFKASPAGSITQADIDLWNSNGGGLTKANVDASNLTPTNIQSWKDKIETQTSIQSPQLTGNILTIYYTGENGVQQSKTVDLSSLINVDVSIENAQYDASQNIITITQTDGSTFKIDLSEFSIITTTNVDGSISLFQEGVEKVKIHKVGISGSYNDLSDLPDLSLKTVGGQSLHGTGDIPFPAESDTLQTVTTRNPVTTNTITVAGVKATALPVFNSTFPRNVVSKLDGTLGWQDIVTHFNPGRLSYYSGAYGNMLTANGLLNMFIGGSTSMKDLTTITGQENCIFSYSDTFGLTSGSNNLGIGYMAGSFLTTGSNNVFLGRRSANGIATGNNNIIIGSNGGNGVNDTTFTSGLTNYIQILSGVAPTITPGDNKLNIGNWIFGDNGNIGIRTGNPNSVLQVGGSFSGNYRSHEL